MIEIFGMGSQSKRQFVFHLSFHEQAAHLKAIHENGIPTAYAIFEKFAFAKFLSHALKLTPQSEPLLIRGRRSVGGNNIDLRAKRVDSLCLRMAMVDASGTTVSSTDFDFCDWSSWALRLPGVVADERTA